MNNRFSRTASSFGLMVSLVTSAFSPAFLPTTALAQEQTSTEKVEKSKKTKKSDKPAKSTDIKQQDTSAATTAAASDPRRPLSVNEDPSMIGKRNINKGLTGWLGGSQSKEAQFGRQLAAQAEKELKLVDDPLVTEYVNRVGQNIVNHSDAKVPFTIKVVDSDEVNAFALPGGFFYVNRGLILAADNESELAGVMAHEIGHVAARHAMENQGKATLINYATMAGIIFGGGILSSVLYNGGSLLQGLAMLKFTRAAEEEADKLGVQYMYAAGYDPNGMATMFEKLSAMNKKKPGKLTKLFATHPESLQRRDASIALAARFPEREEYILSTSEFQRVKAHLLRLSNAKSSIAGDIDDSSENGRPTLKRRQQTADDASGTPTTDSTDDKKDEQKERPQLKRRTEEPQPSPSPSPNQ
ncbi:MAG: M48 family metallopeptidase [Pyrinomonadaceae bacterium]